MRIVAGELKGRKLLCPPGLLTRPTTDRVREALFSSLNSACASYQTQDSYTYAVADLFAGSGALSFEALSRGAAAAFCNDADASARNCIQRNARELALESRVYLASLKLDEKNTARMIAELSSFLRKFDLALGLIFLDPPYACDAAVISRLVKYICESTHLRLSPELLIVYEHARGSAGLSYEGLELIKSKNYGESSLDMYLYELQDKEDECYV